MVSEIDKRSRGPSATELPDVFLLKVDGDDIS